MWHAKFNQKQWLQKELRQCFSHTRPQPCRGPCLGAILPFPGNKGTGFSHPGFRNPHFSHNSQFRTKHKLKAFIPWTLELLEASEAGGLAHSESWESSLQAKSSETPSLPTFPSLPFPSMTLLCQVIPLNLQWLCPAFLLEIENPFGFCHFGFFFF